MSLYRENSNNEKPIHEFPFDLLETQLCEKCRRSTEKKCTFSTLCINSCEKKLPQNIKNNWDRELYGEYKTYIDEFMSRVKKRTPYSLHFVHEDCIPIKYNNIKVAPILLFQEHRVYFSSCQLMTTNGTPSNLLGGFEGLEIKGEFELHKLNHTNWHILLLKILYSISKNRNNIFKKLNNYFANLKRKTKNK